MFLNDLNHLNQYEWLNALEARCQKSPIRLGLENVRAVAKKLDVLSFACPVITVAGTNSKGSTVRALETIYCAAGYNVGVYTSPHLIRFNERITINQQEIDEDSLCQIFKQIITAENHALCDGRGASICLTYFEVGTLAALLYFKKHKLDLIILEVGLGGRLDATNIIDADLAIITTINYDHEAYLGNTLEEIGFEKAGVLKNNKKAILASENMPLSILKVACEKNILLSCYSHDYNDKLTEKEYQFTTNNFKFISNTKPKLHHCAVSAAIMTSQLFKSILPVTTSALEALMQATLRGRLELINIPNQATILLDVSHNIQSVARLRDYLVANYSNQKIHAVFSALSDKPIITMMNMLSSIISFWHIGVLKNQRAATVEQYKSTELNLALNSILWYNDVGCAFKKASMYAEKSDLIVVFGSFYTVADVMLQITSCTHSS